MYQITQQPVDVIVQKNLPFDISVTVEGGAVSNAQTEINNGDNYKNRRFISRGSNGYLYTSADDKTNVLDFQMLYSNTNGYSWSPYTFPDIEGVYPEVCLIDNLSNVVIGTSRIISGQGYIVENGVLTGYLFRDPYGFVQSTLATFKYGGFLGNKDSYTGGQLIRKNNDGNWVHAGLATDTCPNSFVLSNSGTKYLFTLSSENPSSLNHGVFTTSTFDATNLTRTLIYSNYMSICRVTDTRIVVFEFNGAMSAKYTDNDGVTWGTYNNLPLLTNMFDTHWFYNDGHCYISSMLSDRTVYHSYNDGPWEAIVFNDLSVGSIAIPMGLKVPGIVLFSALNSTTAKILEINQSIVYNYELYKLPSSSPFYLSPTIQDTSYTYHVDLSGLSDAGEYFYKIINNNVTLISDTITVTVLDPFIIVEQPFDSSVSEGSSFTISCTVDGGNEALGYVFKVYKDNILISTITQLSGIYNYTRLYASLEDVGTYRIEITNDITTLISDNAIVQVFPIEPTKPTWNHDSSNIIDKSISNFKLSPIEKCYNEFNIDFHKFNNIYLGKIIISNVESDAFPPYSTDGKYWDDPVAITNPFTENGIYYYTLNEYIVTLRKIEDAILILDINANLDEGWKWTVNAYGESVTIECDFMQIESENSINISYKFFKTGGTISTINNNFYFYLISVQKASNIQYNLSDFVQGISDYVTAKDLWTKAHKSWLLNSRIRKASSDRTQLEYAIEQIFIDGPKSNIPDTTFTFTDLLDTDGYTLQYINLLVDWTTRQKLQVSYALPITTDNIKLELMDNVLFSDKIITPEIGEYGKGWITGLQLDPKKSIIKVTITFETMFFIPPSIADVCGDIIENGYNYININESGNLPNNILEGSCPY